MKSPFDWEKKLIEELCDFTNGYGFKSKEWVKTGLPIIRIQNLNGSRNFNYYQGEPNDSWIIEPGDLLFAWAGVPGVSFGPTLWNGPKGVLNQHIYKVEPSKGIRKDWLFLALKIVTSRIEKKAHGFKSSLLHIKKTDITEQIIFVPKESEQREIAKTLGVWERAIDLTEKLLVEKQERRKGLMQGLLSGRRRLPGFANSKKKYHTRWGDYPSEWEYIAIAKLAKNISQRNKEGLSLPVLSCTKHQGLVDSLKYFGKQVFSKDISTYKIVRHAQFVYATNHIEEGSIGYQDIYDVAVVSPMYTVFETNEKIDDRFLFLLLKTELYRKIFEVCTSSSVNRRGSLRWSNFSRISVPLPSIDEQNAIVEVIGIADREINQIKDKLTALREQKKGLMQQLLTGKIRVKT